MCLRIRTWLCMRTTANLTDECVLARDIPVTEIFATRGCHGNAPGSQSPWQRSSISVAYQWAGWLSALRDCAPRLFRLRLKVLARLAINSCDGLASRVNTKAAELAAVELRTRLWCAATLLDTITPVSMDICDQGSLCGTSWRSIIALPAPLDLRVVKYHTALQWSITANISSSSSSSLFSVHGPSVWNSLQNDLRLSNMSLETFRSRLKAFLFRHWSLDSPYADVREFGLYILNSCIYALLLLLLLLVVVVSSETKNVSLLFSEWFCRDTFYFDNNQSNVRFEHYVVGKLRNTVFD